MRSSIIKQQILFLKRKKKDSFIRENKNLDLSCAFEKCRINDMMLLPLYYCWEKICYRQLSEVEFERYLDKPYTLFSTSPIDYTMEIMLLLGDKDNQARESKKLSKIIKTYGEVVNHLLLYDIKGKKSIQLSKEKL